MRFLTSGTKDLTLEEETAKAMLEKLQRGFYKIRGRNDRYDIITLYSKYIC